MFKRNAEKSFDSINNSTANKSQDQFAWTNALFAAPKSIFFEMYQKHKTVTAIFNNNFKTLFAFDSCLTVGSSIVFNDSDGMAKFICEKSVQVNPKSMNKKIVCFSMLLMQCCLTHAQVHRPV